MHIKPCCIEPGCQILSLVNSDYCWHHLEKKDRWRETVCEQVRHGMDFSDAVFVESGLEGLDLTEMKAAGADFTGANLSGTMLQSATLGGVSLKRCKVDELDISSTNLCRAVLDGCHGRKIRSIRSDLSMTTARGSRFMESDFSGSDLQCSDWTGASLTEANLTGIKGINWFAPHSRLNGGDFTDADCEFCVLAGSDLSMVTAFRANFARSNLIGINGESASFREACLHYARLTSARLVDVDFRGADLSRAIFRTSVLIGVKFDGSERTRAVFQRAIM